jgi:hypothetical protein
MKKTKIILFLLILFAFASCKHDEVVCTLKGRILNDCNGAPFANQEIALKQELSSGLTIQGGILAETTTDADGNFVFTYQSENGEPLSINCSGPIIQGIPVKKTQDIGTFFSYGKANFTISLVTSRPFTNLDTLYYTNYVSPETGITRIKVGPFTNQVLDSIVSHTLGGPFNYGESYSTMGVTYYLNKANVSNFKHAAFNVDNCGSWGNVDLVLE